jgi:hypothetical protein
MMTALATRVALAARTQTHGETKPGWQSVTFDLRYRDRAYGSDTTTRVCAIERGAGASERFAIATELDVENDGPSITNTIETLATEVARLTGWAPGSFRLFEHYRAVVVSKPGGGIVRGKDDTESGENVDEVTFPDPVRIGRYSNPDWRRTTLAEVERLTGWTPPGR